jgi:hypothetical protein
VRSRVILVYRIFQFFVTGPVNRVLLDTVSHFFLVSFHQINVQCFTLFDLGGAGAGGHKRSQTQVAGVLTCAKQMLMWSAMLPPGPALCRPTSPAPCTGLPTTLAAVCIVVACKVHSRDMPGQDCI